MKKIRDEIGIFPITEQRLAYQARQIQVNKWISDIEIAEIDKRCNVVETQIESCTKEKMKKNKEILMKNDREEWLKV